ncbi:MAG: uroporphyrinogen-III synthase [Glaciimonas sp.]|nr:uroporphyrinogen-III synthase [Glaciimonas sp.]
MPIVVTRPQAQAAKLAQQVAACGREAVIFPLLEIHALSDEADGATLTLLRSTIAQLDCYAMVVFVSPNAIHAAFQYIAVWPSTIAIGIVGEGSRIALAEYGVTIENAIIYSPLDMTKSDSEGLLQTLDLENLRGQRVLIVRGEGGRPLLFDSLHAAGADVSAVVAYHRVRPKMTEALKKQLRHLLDTENVWVVTSSEALRNLIEMVKQLENTVDHHDGVANDVVKIQRKKIMVSHVRIAETAHQCGFSDVTLTGSGDERLLDALQLSV